MKKTKLIKIPNKIFTYRLKPAAFTVYIYLSGSFYWKKSVQIKLDTIADKCNMSTNTAQTAVNQLVACGLLHKTECFKDRRRTMNEYTIKQLPGSFSLMEKNIFGLGLDNRTFLTLCYIHNRANHAEKSYPSLSQIKAATGLGRTTIIAKVRLLQELGLLYKERYTRREGDYGQNNHTIIGLPLRMVLFSLLSRLSAVCSVLMETIRSIFTVPRLKRFIRHILIKIMVLFSFIRNHLPNCRRIRNTP